MTVNIKKSRDKLAKLLELCWQREDEEVEKVDEHAEFIMDSVRKATGLKSDSDEYDFLYRKIYEYIKRI